MLKRLFTILSLITALAALAEEPATPATYRLNVQNFSELTVVDGVCVDYYCRADSAGRAIFTCLPEVASEIMFSNDNDRLTIQTAANEKALVGIPRIKVYSVSLRKVENSGDSLVRVYTSQPVKQFKASQIGNGSLEVSGIDADKFDGSITAGNGSLTVKGKANKAKISNVGSGPIDAKDLEVPEISCFVFGSGDIEVKPSESLRVYGAGSGKVRYHGTPKVKLRGIGVKAESINSDTAAL